VALVFYNLIPNISVFLENFKEIRILFIIPILLFMVLFISIFPAYWTTGIMGQHRTVNFAFFVCIPFMFLWFLLLINLFELFFQRLYQKIKFFVVFIFVVSISFTRNFQGMIEDIYHLKHLKFNNENNQRYDFLNNHKKKDVFLKRLKTHPFTISIYDLDIDPNHLANIGYQRYWKVKGKVFLIPE
jgi:hypothetical protein